MDPVLISAGIFGIALLSLIYTQSGNYLSLREYATYREFILREIDAVRSRISFLEQTRPTTGELEAKLGSNKCPDPRKLYLNPNEVKQG